MPGFIQAWLYAIVIYLIAMPFINLIDEYSAKTEEQEKRKDGRK